MKKVKWKIKSQSVRNVFLGKRNLTKRSKQESQINSCDANGFSNWLMAIASFEMSHRNMNVNADDILMRILCTDNMAHKKVNERHAVGESIILCLTMGPIGQLQ